MRPWRVWWQNLLWISRQDPPHLVEGMMGILGIILLFVWIWQQRWPYLILSLSYVTGMASMLFVRELIAPTSQQRLAQVIALLTIMVSLYFGITDLLPRLSTQSDQQTPAAIYPDLRVQKHPALQERLN